jgi:hypothetical protein
MLKAFMFLFVGIAAQAAYASRLLSRTPYGTGLEAKSVRTEIGDFDYKSSPVWQDIVQNFGEDLRLGELKRLMLAIYHSLSSQG